MQTIYLSSPLSIELTLTSKCNHKCLHCYNPWRNQIESKKNVMTNEDVEILVKELIKNNVWHVTISGGEPLIESEKMFYLIEKLNNSNITYSINTNLTFMDYKKADLLKNKFNLNTLILTSLPSIDAEVCDQITQVPGSFNKILTGIEICKKSNFKVGINMVMSKKNIEDLDKIYDFIKEKNIDYLSISMVIPPSYDINNPDYYLTDTDIIKIADTLYRINKELNIDVDSVTPIPLCVIKDVKKYETITSTACSAGITRCNVDCEGNIFACSHENEPYGNIYIDGLKKSWDKMIKWRKLLNLNEECKNCDFLNICGGECRMITNCSNNQKYKLKRNNVVSNIDENIKFDIDLSKKYTINKNNKIRKEEFGAVIRINFNDYFLSKQMFKLYKILVNIDNFTIHQLSEFVEIDENFMSVFYYLYKIGLIIDYKGKLL